MNKVKYFFEAIKFSHTLFALPFALISMLISAGGLPDIKTIFWLLIAMVSARSTAMAFNRLIDIKIDGLNPRTMSRHLPTGKLRLWEVVIFVLLTASLFIFSSSMLNRLALFLSPIALAIIYFYSYTKYFTSWSHLFLGLSLSIAPVGACVAVSGRITLASLILGAAVIFWVAGFDILYACQDYEFDKGHGLYSIVVRYGIKRALSVSLAFHIIMAVMLILFGIVARLGVIITGVLIIYQHRLVKPDDISKVNTAFFTANGIISIILMLATYADFYV
ncbi:MAG: UbiA family prenyltransferase [Candidatus Omnitrophica bacterium]|nr:UbiA family prenyltransferase [Candidatus Omnitrophota bacterium]